MTSLDFNTLKGRADIAKTVEACKVRGLIKFPVQSSSMAEQRPVKASLVNRNRRHEEPDQNIRHAVCPLSSQAREHISDIVKYTRRDIGDGVKIG